MCASCTNQIVETPGMETAHGVLIEGTCSSCIRVA